MTGDARLARWLRWAAVTGDPWIAEHAERMIASEEIRQLETPGLFFVPDDPQQVTGPVALGREVHSELPVGFSLDDGHLLVLGATRTGKTNLVNVLLYQTDAYLPFWAFDQKRDTRHLVRLCPAIQPVRLDSDLLFNPLLPYAGVNRQRWAQVFADLFCQGHDLLVGSRSLVHRLLSELYDKAPEPGPTMREFRKAAENALGHSYGRVTREYAERVLNRLDGLECTLGRTFDCVSGWPMPELARACVSFECDGLDTASLQFTTRCLVYANYCWRMETQPRGDVARQLIVIDEAANLASETEEQKTASGVPHIDLLFQRGGEFGLRFVVCSQTPRLAFAVNENTRITVCFGLSDGHGYDSIARRLRLSPDEVTAMRGLGTGLAVVHSAGRYSPMLVQVHHLKLTKDVTDAQVAAHVAPFLARMTVSVARRAVPDVEPRRAAPGELQLDYTDETLVRHVCAFPALSWTERAKLLRDQHGIAATAAQKALKRLENLGLVERAQLRKTGGRGSNFVGLVLTSKGREYLQKRGVRVGKATRGDGRHRLWLDIVRAWYEAQGLECDSEVELTSRVFADVVIKKPGGERVAVEIELGTETAVRNASKLQGLGLDRVILACDGDALVEAVRRTVGSKLPPEAVEKLEFVPLQAFLEPPAPAS